MHDYHKLARLGSPGLAGIERSACGLGFIASLDGAKSRHVLDLARLAVGNLEQRGAVSADGLTGDGAGVLTQISHAFFRAELAQRGLTLEQDEDLALHWPASRKNRNCCITISGSALPR